MSTETWYVLEDGSAGDPREIAPDKNGVLRHKDGRAVAYAPHGPRTRSVDTEAPSAGKRSRKQEREAETPETADMQPETPKRGYKTRESKAD
jgi:hypothetical protein